jgi:hypothetical protein
MWRAACPRVQPSEHAASRAWTYVRNAGEYIKMREIVGNEPVAKLQSREALIMANPAQRERSDHVLAREKLTHKNESK